VDGRFADPARIAATMLATALAVLLPPLVLGAIAQRDQTPLWWSVAVLTPPAVALALAVRAREVTAVRLLVPGTVLALLTAIAVADGRYRAGATPWVVSLYPTAAAACCLISRRVWINVVCLAGLVVSHLALATSQVWRPEPRLVVGDVLFGVAVSAIGYAVLQASRASAESVREAQAMAVERFEAARAAEAQTRAANAWDAYVHDEVLAALTDVAAGGPDAATHVEAVIQQARSRHWQLPGTSLEQGILDAVLTLWPDADTEFDVAADAMPLTHEARSALVEAVCECLRNVSRHAWPDGMPAGRVDVRLRHDGTGARAEVRDEGVGFDERHTDPSRLGLHVSVYGRMHAAGGSARVVTVPGSGTSVRLCWPASPGTGP
jgi:signal transduction histidine kinase